MDEVKRWEIGQLLGFEAIEGPQQPIGNLLDISKDDDEDEEDEEKGATKKKCYKIRKIL